MDRRVAGSKRFGKRSDVDAVMVLLLLLPLLMLLPPPAETLLPFQRCELLLECLDGKAGGDSRLKDAADGGEEVCDEIPVGEGVCVCVWETGNESKADEQIVRLVVEHTFS